MSSITILSYARKIRKGLRRLALCQGQRSCRVKKWEKWVEVFIYDFPKLHHSSPNSFGANGHLHKKVCKTGKVRKVTWRQAKTRKVKGPPRSPCALNMVQWIISGVTAFWKKYTPWSAAIWKVQWPNWFSNLSSPEWRKAANFERFRLFFFSLTAQVGTFAREEVGQMEL